MRGKSLGSLSNVVQGGNQGQAGGREGSQGVCVRSLECVRDVAEVLLLGRMH